MIDEVEEDYFNLTDIDVIALGAGYKYKSYVLYLWKLPFESLDNGLRPLQCDADVTEFLYHASYYRFMDVYFDATPLYSILMLTHSRPITARLTEIEEIEDSDNDEEMEVDVQNSSASSDDVVIGYPESEDEVDEPEIVEDEFDEQEDDHVGVDDDPDFEFLEE